MKKTRATNPQLLELIDYLKKQSRENQTEIWRDIAERLTRARRRSVGVNVSRLNRFSRKSETVAVAGKVLGTGEVGHPITVAAFAFSEKAREKIEASKGKCVSYVELVKKNPKGSNVKIIG